MSGVSEQLITIITANVLNVIFSGIIIITYFISKNLQQHPSGIIVSIAFCELAISYHSTIYLLDTKSVIQATMLHEMRIFRHLGIDSRSAEDFICGINEGIYVTALVAGIMYNLVLCIDLIISLRYPFSQGNKRMKFYHIACAVGTLVLSTNLNIVFIKSECYDGGTKDSDKLTILNFHAVFFLLVFYCFVGLVSIIYAEIRIHTGVKVSNTAIKKYIVRHIFYVAIYIFSWGCVIFLYIYNIYNQKSDSLT